MRPPCTRSAPHRLVQAPIDTRSEVNHGLGTILVACPYHLAPNAQKDVSLTARRRELVNPRQVTPHMVVVVAWRIRVKGEARVTKPSSAQATSPRQHRGPKLPPLRKCPS